MTTPTGRAIGIDLGTTFSAMAYLDRHGMPVTLRNSEGELTTPSAVLFEPEGEVIVGQGARRASLLSPERVALCVKRDMGLKFFEHPVAGKRRNPAVLAAFILHKLKQNAEAELGQVSGAVITVPAYFDEARRQATADAGAIAGLEVLDIINEPTAAALAYAFKTHRDAGGDVSNPARAAGEALAPSTVLVYDLGGGTFDVTVLRIDGADLQVIATEGEVRLGGTDWDERVMAHAAERFMEQYGSDPREDPQSHQDLALLAEEAKKDLSRRESVRFAVNHAGNRLAVTLTRIEFNEMTADLLFRTESRAERVIRQSKLTWDDVDEVLLVGGATRMPQVRRMLAEVTGRQPNGTLAADEVVAHGAAIQAAIVRSGGKQRLAALMPVPVEPDDVPVVEPIVAAPPPESEAAGSGVMAQYAAAALQQLAEAQAAADAEYGAEYLQSFDPEIGRTLQSIHTRDVNAHSLGVVAFHPRSGKEVNSILIPRNTPLPASCRKVYGTIDANQQMVRVRIIEGDSPDPSVCTPLGECVISELPPELPRGSRIAVLFTLDASGRLHVEAREEAHGHEAHTVIIRSSTMSPSELDEARNEIGEADIS